MQDLLAHSIPLEDQGTVSQFATSLILVECLLDAWTSIEKHGHRVQAMFLNPAEIKVLQTNWDIWDPHPEAVPGDIVESSSRMQGFPCIQRGMMWGSKVYESQTVPLGHYFAVREGCVCWPIANYVCNPL